MIDSLRALGFKDHDQPTASELKKAWKELCRKHHPDVNGGDDKKFLEITHHYNMLVDGSYRYEYLLKSKRKANANVVGDLNVRITVPISFEDGLYGRKFNLSWNQLQVDTETHQYKVDDLIVLHNHVVDIPPGTANECEFNFSGAGHRCGNDVGMATIVVKVNKHPKFSINGRDIISNEHIPLDIMLKGGEVDVQTAYGVRTLKVPAGTGPNSMLRIKKCGVGQQGYHIVIIHPLFPSKEQLKQGSWKGLDIDWTIEEEKEDFEMDAFQRLFSSRGGYVFTSSTRGTWP